MDATFTARGGGDPVAQFRLARFAAQPTRGDLLFGGSLAISIIRDRTLAGNDVDGSPFAPYSDKYAGRKSAALGHGRVDLFSSEHHTHMLNALQTVVDSEEAFGVGIYTNDELEARARVHNEGLTVRTRLGTGKGKPKKNGKASFEIPRRHWLDLSGSELDTIHDAMGERIDERLRLLS